MDDMDASRAADRSAWLEENPDDLTILMSDNVSAADYWREIEGTVAWAGFVWSRRVEELVAPARVRLARMLGWMAGGRG